MRESVIKLMRTDISVAQVHACFNAFILANFWLWNSRIKQCANKRAKEIT